MALPSTYTQAYGVLEEFFGKIRDAQAPEKFTHQILKDLGFKSNTHRAFIPIMKALGFLTADGAPTSRYTEYRDHSQSKRIMGDALKEAYSDIFLIKSHPTESDKNLIEGKFKSYHNTSENTASLMAKNFFALLKMAEINFDNKPKASTSDVKSKHDPTPETKITKEQSLSTLGLHYNIQIHLPATKDVEVYNAIFKSLKEHLIE
jgi:hypothetical protein